jgi:hypothetical protein
MGYTRVNGVQQLRPCTSEFRPQSKSYFVDTIPDLKTRKIGTSPQDPVQCSQTTSGVGKEIRSDGVAVAKEKAIPAFNSYSPRPHNPERGKFITGIQGPQVGGQENGGRADKVGGAVPRVKRDINHRGWGGRTRMPYPYPRVPPSGSPAQLKINQPNNFN